MHHHLPFLDASRGIECSDSGSWGIEMVNSNDPQDELAGIEPHPQVLRG